MDSERTNRQRVSRARTFRGLRVGCGGEVVDGLDGEGMDGVQHGIDHLRVALQQRKTEVSEPEKLKVTAV